MTNSATTSVFDNAALTAHAAWRQRERAISVLLARAGWTAGDPLSTVIHGMPQAQRDELIGLLEQQAVGL